jgi:hypothetical protein
MFFDFDNDELMLAMIVSLFIILLFCLPAHSEKSLYNYDVPLRGCAEKVTLLGCDPDSKPFRCKSVSVHFVSTSCLMLEVHPK